MSKRLAGLILLLAAPTVGTAQERRELRLSTSLGIYLPVGGPMIDEPAMGLRKQQIITGLGIGRLVLWMHPRVGLEGVVQYGKGQVAIRDTAQARVVSDVRANLWLANLRMLVRLTPATGRRLSGYMGTGMGLVGRSGRAFDDTPARTTGSFLMLIGASATLGKGRRGPAIRLELEDNISRTQFNVGLPTQTRALWHQDIIWSLGASFSLWSIR